MLEFLFSSFWTWSGGIILLLVVAHVVVEVIRAVRGEHDGAD